MGWAEIVARGIAGEVERRIGPSLTPAEIEQFNSAGYLVFSGLIGGARLRKYHAMFARLAGRSSGMTRDENTWILEKDADGRPIPGMLHKIQAVALTDPGVMALAREPEIVGRVTSLIGHQIDMFGSKFFPKLPGGGTSVDWHQDNFYFKDSSMRILSCGIYIEAADRTNGCLRVIPGSHLHGIQEHDSRIPDARGAHTAVDESKAVDVICPGGTVVVFSVNMIHGAYENNDPANQSRSRYSTAWHYLPADMELPPFNRPGYMDRHRIQ